ncbi:hypothetical protein [Flavitalea sp.]|nr:hypothetical protein [Flavitalea sp.]
MKKHSSSFGALYTGKEYKDANKIPEKLKIGVEIRNPGRFNADFGGIAGPV